MQEARPHMAGLFFCLYFRTGRQNVIVYFKVRIYRSYSILPKALLGGVFLVGEREGALSCPSNWPLLQSRLRFTKWVRRPV
jgi:hypothetical protein